MTIQLQFALRGLLQSVISGMYTESHVRELHRFIYSIAHHHVRRKIAAGKLKIALLGLSECDITHDCIADLFARTETGQFSEIHKYLSSLPFELGDVSEELLFVYIRRLVFSFVNDSIFRLYNEIDPDLGKIIRNVKIAVGRSTHLRMVMRFDEQYLELATEDTLPHLPTIEDEDLTRVVTECLGQSDDTPTLLQKIGELLRDQKIHRRWVRLVSLALAIRDAYQCLGFDIPDCQADQNPSLLIDDIRTTIAGACRRVELEMRPRYVDRRKVDSCLFSQYMKAIEDILNQEFTDGLDGQTSYYWNLKTYFPSLSRLEYRQNHRAVFEYLVTMARTETRRNLLAM